MTGEMVDRWRGRFRDAGVKPSPIQPEYVPLEGAEPPRPPGGRSHPIELRVVQAAQWDGVAVPPRVFIVDGLIPSRNVTLLSGDGGLGKTLLALQLMVTAAQKLPWLGAQTEGVKSLGLFCEDEEDELQRRLVDIAAHYRCKLADLADIGLMSRVGEDNILVEFDRLGHGQPTPLYTAVANRAISSGARLVILDSLHDLFGGKEEVRSQVRQFVGYLRKLAIRIDGAVLVTSHPSLTGISSGSGSSGSTGWHNTVRSRLYFTRSAEEDHADDGARVLKTMKQNYGPRGDAIDLQWSDGVFKLTAAGGDPYREAEAVFLVCLDKIRSQRSYVSATITSQRYAPAVFAQMPESRRLGRKKLASAMATLQQQNKIAIGEHRQPNRHIVNAIVRAE